MAYLDDRLNFFAELLTEAQGQMIRQGFAAFASKWE